MVPAPLLALVLAAAAAAAEAMGDLGNSYDPVADPAAIVLCSSTLRLSILTEKIVRAESLPSPGLPFEDRATISFVNRRLPVPTFTFKNTSEWCNVSIRNGYEVAVRKLVNPPPPPGPQPPAPPTGTCEQAHIGHDAKCDGPCERVAPVTKSTQAKCCAACDANDQCGTWVFDSSETSLCYLLAHGTVTGLRTAANRTLGGETGGHGPGPGPKLGLRAPGVLQTSGDGWSWNAWDDEDPESNPSSPNLLGTLLGTPSADLAGCCNNPNASAGQYDPKSQYALQPGLLSRAGCTAVDDSGTPLYDIVDGNLDDAWLANTTALPPVDGRDDLYIFGCGSDYRGCLADFVRVAGPIALPPLSSMGVWWSRHWGNPHNIPWGAQYFGEMSEDRIMNEVVAGYTQRNLPMHVLVMDMEWHTMFSEPCYTGGPGNWGGYTWNKTLFPDQHAFVAKLNAMRGPLGIKVAVNTHPDVGINACQENYASMAAAIGFETDGNKTMTDLNQACGTEAAEKSLSCSRQYVEAYFKYMINPTPVSGASVAADYSWTDSPDVTTFTNELYVRYPGTKRNKRSINFSRYGGLGQHRTPVGFSGDTLRQWDTLTYQTYFTPRSANVGFGWWSHDIGGFSGSPVDAVFHTEGPELYLRW